MCVCVEGRDGGGSERGLGDIEGNGSEKLAYRGLWFLHRKAETWKLVIRDKLTFRFQEHGKFL